MSAAEIIDAIGREKAAQLSRLLGGKFVYVPQEPTPDNAIAEAIDLPTLQTLTDAIGSGVLYIPVGIYKRQRDQEINQLLAQGASARRVARAYRLSPRTIRHLSRFARMEQQNQRQAHDRPATGTLP